MPYVIGTESALQSWSRDIDTQEGLPKSADAWPPGVDPQLDWEPGAPLPMLPGETEQRYASSEPPVGWTVHYYGEPRELEDGRFAIAIEDRHLALVTEPLVVEGDVTWKVEPLMPMEPVG